MRFISPKDFTAERAWGALPIADMNGVTTRLQRYGPRTADFNFQDGRP